MRADCVSIIGELLGLSSAEAAEIDQQNISFLEKIRKDLSFFQNATHKELEIFWNKKVRIEGLEHLEAAIAENRPIIMIGGHFACGYITFFAFKNIATQRKVYTIKAGINDRTIRINDNISKVVGVELEDIVSGATSTPRIFKQLKKGCILCSYYDYYVESGPFVISSLLNNDLACPSALLSLSFRTCSVLLPAICILDDNGRYVISFKEVLNGSSEADQADENSFVMNMSDAINKIIEEQIIKSPEQWQLWDSLQNRIAFTQRLVAQLG